MIGVAVFGALIAKDATFMAGLKVVVALAAGVLARSAAIAMAGKRSR
jgi:hypothetical protein